MKTLVLGIGNTLLSDEGIGIHVIHALPNHLADEDAVELLDGGTLSFTLAGPIAATTALIVVDAAQIQSAPGTVRVLEGAEMKHFLAHNRKSTVHEVGLVDLMTIAQLTESWPAYHAMVAIQPSQITWGESPTPQVAAAIPNACAAICALIKRWRSSSGPVQPSR